MKYLMTILVAMSLVGCGQAQMEFRSIVPPVCTVPGTNPIAPTPPTVVVSTPTGPMTCMGYTQLIPISGVVVVPQRDVYQTCYYVKLFDAVGYTLTSANVLDRPDVQSVNYDGNTPNPKIIGSTNSFGGATKSFSLVLQGQRYSKFSADSQGLTKASVDNFFLIEVGSQYGYNAIGFGTQDCSPVGGMKVNGVPVISYSATSAGGTATVPVTDLSSLIDTNTITSFRAAGLDCGGASNVSSGFLVFE